MIKSHWRSGDYVVYAIGAEQRWILYQAESATRKGSLKSSMRTLIPGAGTTSERQFYTYTDTTAQPNVVYYYQIEDVSLDGNRQTLTRGMRLKGHMWVRLGKRRRCGEN